MRLNDMCDFAQLRFKVARHSFGMLNDATTYPVSRRRGVARLVFFVMRPTLATVNNRSQDVNGVLSPFC
jgi:hypothetical protein